MKKLPKYWWLFLPTWLWPPAFFGMVFLFVHFGRWLSFFVGSAYALLGLLVLIPIRRSQMSIPEAWMWVALGNIVVGLPAVALIYLIFGKH
jgi:hypothetical protein